MIYLEEWIKEENEHVVRMAKMQQKSIKKDRKFTILGIICISVPWIVDIVLVCISPAMGLAITLCLLSALSTWHIIRDIRKVHRNYALFRGSAEPTV